MNLRPDPTFHATPQLAMAAPSVEGKLDRMVGSDQLFGWGVSGVPLKLMPPEITWYRQTVNYRARLNTQTGKLRVRGDFVQRYVGGSSGTNMVGVGVCERT